MKAIITKLCTAALMMALYLTPSISTAQTDKIEVAVVKDGFVMIDDEVMAINKGKLSLLKKTATMENGTKIRKNGSVKAKGARRVKLENGNCIDHSGKIENCNVGSQHYTCTMHKDVRAAKNGKCPQCGMDLVKRN